MNEQEFCVAMKPLGYDVTKQAVCLLWFVDKEKPNSGLRAGEIAKIIANSGLSNPHSTRLGDSLKKSGHTLSTGSVFRIKPTSRSVVQEWLSSVLAPPAPQVDQSHGYLPKDVWDGPKVFSYIKRIAEQANGCYQFGLYDAASVMVRRIIETLLIECYEHLNIESKIKRPDGTYPMLSGILAGAIEQKHLTFSRDTEKALKELKKIGDRAAHNRRYAAVKADLDTIDARLVVDELLHLAGQK